MIEISFGKLLLLALVALIVLGPERLPGVARTAGALLRRMRNGWESVRSEVERELQAEEIKQTLRDAAASARATHADLRNTVDQVRDSFTERQLARAEAEEKEKAQVAQPTQVAHTGETPKELSGTAAVPKDDMHDRS